MRNSKILKTIGVVALVLLFLTMGIEADAQCPMCKMAAESNLKDGGTAGQGLNKGILYIFIMPYLMVATLGYLWWRNRRTEEEMMMGEEINELMRE